MTQSRILIADDEPLYLRTTGELLRKAGYDCVCVPDAEQALRALRDQRFDLVLSDLNMPGNLKLELLQHHSQHHPGTPIVVVTGVPSLPTAIESIRLGITDYLLKPVKYEDLLASVRRAIAKSKRRPMPTPLPADRPSTELAKYFPGVIGKSRAILELFEIIDRVAQTDTNILITGESGTGKEVVARAIHEHSHRREGKFQVIDCTSIPESLFESMLFGHKKGAFTGAVSDQVGLLERCDGGTAFFDELGELPLPLQAKLLRAVQAQTFTPVGSHTPVTVDTRFICATNRDLQLEVNAGRFRQDLFYRLSVIHVELPPLRDRGEDIVLLADHFLKTLQGEHPRVQGFDHDAVDCLRRYRWPGNIRELRNVIERAIALSRDHVISPEAFPDAIRQAPRRDDGSTQAAFAGPQPAAAAVGGEPGPSLAPASREEALRVAEHQYLVGLMRRHEGNVSQAARQAGMSRQGMHKLLRSHEIRAADYRS
jgi:DNA-binding NtrC family response regulator